MSNQILVSGVGVPQNAIAFPSGLFATGTPGSNLNAFLASMNAAFGFNLTPHAFQLEFVPIGDPCTFHGASGQLPPINHPFELYIGDFYLRGKVTHADYTSSPQGTIVNVTVEDNRKELRRVKIHTEDLGDSVPSGVVSVARAYREINGLTNVSGVPSDPLVREYKRILENGATYAQVLAAVDLAFNEGAAAIPVSELPTTDKLELNIGGEIDAIRFQFNLTQLDEVMTRILQDTGFDWYWNMDAGQMNLINKKSIFDIQENDILDLISEFGSASGLIEGSTRSIGFGEDVVSEPTRFRLLGGHQQGFINSELLSPLDGVDTTALDGNVVFEKAWDKLTIGFYDAGGFYRTYTPTEKELQMALAGIEQWSYFKIYQTDDPSDDPPGFGLPSDAGHVAAQDFTFQSRFDPLMPLAGEATGAGTSGIRIISNRRDENHNWVLSFYERLRNHASRHYARSYVIEGLLFNDASGLFNVTNAAWANVENQLQGATLSQSGTVGGLFTDDYRINQQLGPISPFLTDNNRVTAHCVLPADTVYGPQGDDVPASFGNWTEDAAPFNPSGDGRHYIPVDLSVVGQRVVNPRSDDLYAFEDYPEGTLWCQLPVNCGPSSGLIQDAVLSTLETIITSTAKIGTSGLRDIQNPAKVLNAYQTLSGVAIPVTSRLRYGQNFPTTWVTGTLHPERDEDVQLDDQFVPWAFFPVGDQTSLDVMTERAFRRVTGKVVPHFASRYADFSQVGLPLLSFDAFASQSIGPSGLYGEISHGVSELSIQFGDDGFSTRYKIQSFFPQFGRDAPLGERTRGLLDGIINPIDFTDLNLLDPLPVTPSDPFLPGNPLPPIEFFDTEKRAVRVTIEEVNNVFTLADDPSIASQERYRGRDLNGYDKPPRFSSPLEDFTEGAICIDGFLNPGDNAIYHTDEFELPNGKIIFRYFTQGRPFGNATIVEVARVNADDANKYDVTIVDPSAEAAVPSIVRAIAGLEVLNGTVSIGDKTTTAAQGDAVVRPGNNAGGVFLNGTATGGSTPAEIILVNSEGTTAATANARRLGSSGVSDLTQPVTSGVYPIPFPQFAASGDKGMISTVTVSGVTTNYMLIVKPAFHRFGDC